MQEITVEPSSIHLEVPMSVYITVVRGQLKQADSLEENQDAHDAINVPLQALSKSLSAVGHRAYLNAKNPKEFLWELTRS